MADSDSSGIKNTEVSPKHSPRKKRESFLGDELLSFDPVEFDSVEADAWGDVFDEEDGNHNNNNNNRPGPAHDNTESSHSDSLPKMSLSSNNSNNNNNENSEKFVGRQRSESNDENPIVRRETSQGSSASGSTPNWQDDNRDAVLRLKMMKDITQRLVARKKIHKPNDPIVLPRIQAQARAFESQLYKNAASLEEYSDRSTLKRRLALLADRFFSHFQKAKKQRSSSKLGDSSLKTDMAQSKQSPSVHSLPGPLQGANNHHRSTSTASSGPSQPLESGKMGDFLSNSMDNGNALAPSNQSINPAVQQNLMANLQQQQMMAARQQANMLNLANNQQMLAQNQMMMSNGLPMFQMMQQQQQQQGNMMNMNLLQQQNLMRQNAMNMAMLNQQQQQQLANGGAFGANLGGMGMNNNSNPMGNMGIQQGMNLGNFTGMNMMNAAMMGNPGMVNNNNNNMSMPQQQQLNKPNEDTVSPGNFNW